MKFYTRKAVNIISIIITIIIFFILNVINSQKFKFNYFNFEEKSEIQNQVNEIINSEETESAENINDVNNVQNESLTMEKYEWCIYIPNIELIAPIEETVEKEVMNRSVGHFSNTSNWNGNIGLGAHNRGYKVNYFENIKKLKRGDSIFYKYNGQIRQYLVSNIVIIKDTDWSYLEETEENKITLITCVENEPNYRRCIQGVEK